jgi:hypothetical protein
MSIMNCVLRKFCRFFFETCTLIFSLISSRVDGAVLVHRVPSTGKYSFAPELLCERTMCIDENFDSGFILRSKLISVLVGRQKSTNDTRSMQTLVHRSLHAWRAPVNSSNVCFAVGSAGGQLRIGRVQQENVG